MTFLLDAVLVEGTGSDDVFALVLGLGYRSLLSANSETSVRRAEVSVSVAMVTQSQKMGQVAQVS